MPQVSRGLGAILLLFLSPLTALAQVSQEPSVPRVINITGVFRPADGQPPAAVETVTLAIYADAIDGAPLWQETQTVALDDKGRYSVLLGASTPDGIPASVFASGTPQWLGTRFERPGEVEGRTSVGGTGEHDDLDMGRCHRQLTLEALVAGDGEGPKNHVERVADRGVGDAARHVEHVDPVDRPGQGVGEGHVVDDPTVDQRAVVVEDGREAARQGGAGQEGRLERAGGQHDLLARGQVAGDDPQRNHQLGELRGGGHLVDEPAQPGV